MVRSGLFPLVELPASGIRILDIDEGLFGNSWLERRVY